MSHYSKEIAQIRAEEKAEKKRQKELTKEMNLQNIKEMKARISAMSPEERIALAHKIANEIRLNEAKLKDNKDKLNAADDDESLDILFNLGASAILGGALGTTISLLTGSDSAELTGFVAALFATILSVKLEYTYIRRDTKHKFRLSKIMRNKAEKNIENLERESDALDEIKAHLNETYGIKVKVPASRLLGLDREM